MLNPTDLVAGLQNYGGGTQQGIPPEALVRALLGQQMAMNVSPDEHVAHGQGYREGYQSALDDKAAGTRVEPYPGNHPYTRGWREGYTSGMTKPAIGADILRQYHAGGTNQSILQPFE